MLLLQGLVDNLLSCGGVVLLKNICFLEVRLYAMVARPVFAQLTHIRLDSMGIFIGVPSCGVEGGGDLLSHIRISQQVNRNNLNFASTPLLF